MFKKFSILRLGLILASLNLFLSCSSTRPYFVSKGSGYYEIGAFQKDEVYRAGFEVCRGIYQNGFQIISPSTLQPNKLYGGLVRCSGKVDLTLEKQYRGSPQRFFVVDGLGEEKAYFEIK